MNKMEDGSNNSNINSSSNVSSNNPNSNSTKTNNRCNLIVNYLPQSLKEHDFNLLFSKIGQLKTCKLMFDRQTGYSFGYGFVEYVNEEDACKAIETLNGYQIEHKRLKVALARPNCEDTKNTNLYIRNIPLTFDEQLLHDLFSQYGEVVQVRLLRDQNTAFSRRIGFVIMATKQMAQLAIQHLDNTIPPNGGSEPIYVKYADEEGKKRHGPSGNSNVGNNMRINNSGLMNQHHQNQYQNSNNYLSQQSAHGFNFNNPNSFMMSNNNQAGLNPLANNLQNLGKMKTNRSSGHQNRYNPIGAAATGMNNQGGINNIGPNASNNGTPGNNYNPWNMNMAAAAAAAAAAIQQPYSNFGSNQNNIVGNSGFDNLINTIGTGGTGGGNSGTGGGGGGGNYSNANMHQNFNQQLHGHPHQNHQLQQQHFNSSSNANSYLNLSSAAAAGLGNNSTNTNLLDVSSIGINANSNVGNIPMDTGKSNTLGNMSGGGSNVNGHIIYVYGIGQANESDLYSLFSNCGRILRVNVIKNQKTGQCKGYGFVVFETYEEAYYAVHNMNGYMYNHRPLQVQLNAGHLD